MLKKSWWKPHYLYVVVVIILALIILWAILNETVTLKELAVGFLAALGTFLGALLAFRLNEYKDLNAKLLQQKTALRRALFVLARQTDAINSLLKLITPFETEIERALNLPAYKTPTYADLKQNFDELEFLLEAKYVNTLMRLAVEQERFHQSMEALRLRNEFYVDDVLPLLSKGSMNGKNLTQEDLLEGLGERVFYTAINYANALYFHVEENIESVKAIHLELFNVAKEIYPNDKFIKAPIHAPSERQSQ